MSEPSLSNILSELNELRQELAKQTQSTGDAQWVALSQAVDRLYIRMQTGLTQSAEARSAMEEIRNQMPAAAAKDNALDDISKYIPSSAREEALMRNNRDLVKRFTADTRAWDPARVEIMQGALASFASIAPPELKNATARLQNDLSNSLWAGDTRSLQAFEQIERDAQSFKDEILARIAEKTKKLNYQGDNGISNGISENLIRTAMDSAKSVGLKNLAETDADPATRLNATERLRAMQNEVRERQINMAKKIAAEKDAQLYQEILEESQNATRELMQRESERLNQYLKDATQLLSPVLQNSDAKKLLDDLNDPAFDNLKQSPSEASFSAISKTSDKLLSDAISIATEKGISAEGLKQLQLIRENARAAGLRAASASAISESLTAQASPDVTFAEDNTAQIEARAMYEQQKMRFETVPSTRTFGDDMHIAQNAPSENTRRTSTFDDTPMANNTQNAVQRLRGLIEESQQASFVSRYAGAEFSANARKSLQISNANAPIRQELPQHFDTTSKRVNQILSSMQNLANSPSMQKEMGFQGKAYQINETNPSGGFQPASFRKNTENIQSLLPQLQQITEMTEHIRSQFANDAQASGVMDFCSNFTKIIEENFAKIQKNDSIAEDRAQKAKEKSKRKEKDIPMSLNPNLSDPLHLASTLRADSQEIPHQIYDKLHLITGSDNSGVRSFSGDNASAAAKAMKTNAFRIGNNIYFNKKALNIHSPEGLGILAQDIKKDSPDDDLMKALGMQGKDQNGTYSGFSKDTLKQSLARDRKPPEPPKPAPPKPVVNTVIQRPVFDLDDVFDEVTDMLADILHDEFERERLISGN